MSVDNRLSTIPLVRLQAATCLALLFSILLSTPAVDEAVALTSMVAAVGPGLWTL